MNKKLLKIKKVAKNFNIQPQNMDFYGDYIAKLKTDKINRQEGKLILVTAINPTKYGEGKTTVSIGLADGMNSLGKKTVLALREPSLGPVFGVKGGASGGGEAQILPTEEINLHFTGDFHAITSANNLICSMIDNNFYFGNSLNLNPETICFHRCVDMNDRALRDIDINIDGKFVRKERFNITAASEIMAIVGLSKNITELKQRISKILIGFSYKNKPIYVQQLKCVEAVVALLKQCLKPNIVQTKQGNLSLVHIGPFANISYGCNSVFATKTALKIGDYAITEAGFGADLGAEKFLDFLSQTNNLKPNVVVLIATIRALKLNGGASENEINIQNIQALKNGLKILFKHYNFLTKIFNLNVVVAINKFSFDIQEELDFFTNNLKQNNIENVVCDPYNLGGDGCVNLAKKVVQLADINSDIKFCYNLDDCVEEKINKVVKNLYGAENIIYSSLAKEKLKLIKQLSYDNLPIVIAKTQYSLSDNPKAIGVVGNFDFTITDLELQTGAGYIIVFAGKTLLMPALNKEPNATKIKINNKGKIIF